MTDDNLYRNETPVRRLLDSPDGIQSWTTRLGRSSLPTVRRSKSPSSPKGRQIPEASPPPIVGQENDNPNTRKAAKGYQRRFWVFTSNDLKKADKLLQAQSIGLEAFDGSVRYICFQQERGKGGHDHYQGYVEFKRSYRLNDVRRRVCDSAHWEPRRGTAAEAIAYCKKDDTRIAGPWESGKPSKGMGTRSDLEALKDAIKGGKRRRELLDEFPCAMGKYPKFYESVKLASQDEGWRKVEVILLIGDTGTGKTRWVYNHWLDKGFWRLPMVTTGLWFDTYDLQTHVLLDDFAGAASKVSLSSLLQILDGYWIKVPIKGGFTWWGPSHIAVTCNIQPRYWYKWDRREHQYMALARRFHTIYVFDSQSTDLSIYPTNQYFHADDLE